MGSVGWNETNLPDVKDSTQMTNVPDLSDLPIILRRFKEVAFFKMGLMKFKKGFIAKLLSKL